MPVIALDGSRLASYDSFHATFAQVMGFPSFYGRNLDAWIDCMTSLDQPEDGMSIVYCIPPDVVTLNINNAEAIPEDIWLDLLECAAFVNYRRLEQGQPPVLAISAHRPSV